MVGRLAPEGNFKKGASERLFFGYPFQQPPNDPTAIRCPMWAAACFDFYCGGLHVSHFGIWHVVS